MAEQKAVESPDYDMIEKQSGYAVKDAVKLLYDVLNQEISNRRVTVREAKNKLEGAVTQELASASVNNYDATDRQTVWFSNNAAFNVTGIRNGIDGRMLVFVNLGTGDKTFKHLSGSSDTANQIFLAGAADKAVAQHKSLVLQYLNGKWRELSLA